MDRLVSENRACVCTDWILRIGAVYVQTGF